jgi:hypothetical protein
VDTRPAAKSPAFCAPNPIQLSGFQRDLGGKVLKWRRFVHQNPIQLSGFQRDFVKMARFWFDIARLGVLRS